MSLERLYYAESSVGTIFSTDYHGGNRSRVFVKTGAVFFDLAIFKVKPNNKYIHVCMLLTDGLWS